QILLPVERVGVQATAPFKIVLEIFSNPERYNGKTLPIVGDIISPREMVETFQRVTGRKAAYRNDFNRDGLLHYFPEFA
ncbi:NmrA family NAD(P)-binding protein, partial [Rhizobium ruizarguesonis]